MLKHKILLTLLMCFLITPSFAEDLESIVPADKEEIVQEIDSQESLPPVENITEKKDINLMSDNFKQPVSKKKVAKKFLLAMLGVCVSSFLIFGILSIYNKIRRHFVPETEDIRNDSLETPDSLNDAVRTFLEKTKWD